MKTELILLAAGQSKRFDGIKQLADIHGQPMICHCLSQYRKSDKWLDGIAQGHVVLGSSAELVNAVLPKNVATFVANTWQQGMGHSLAESIQIIANDTSHVMIGLADQVSISQQMILSMLEESRKHPKKIIAANYNGGLGAPVIFPKQYFSQLSLLTGDKGAKTLLQSNIQEVFSLAMPKAALDIDTLKDLRSI